MTKILQGRRLAEVIPLRPVASAKALEAWKGRCIADQGFCTVSSMLLRTQVRLGLNLAQLAILLHLVDHCWGAGMKAHPSKRCLAARLRLGPRQLHGPRQLQRYIAELEKAGLVRRVERRAPHRGKLSNEYDLSGLVARLVTINPGFGVVLAACGLPTKSSACAGGRHGDA